jgi:exodeoxyribonuclease-3
MNAFRRKMGLRIDHILLSEALAKACTVCSIDTEPRRNERPSDHAPVLAELDLRSPTDADGAKPVGSGPMT